MVNPIDILPILALALAIALVPLLGDGAPRRQRALHEEPATAFRESPGEAGEPGWPAESRPG